MSRLSKIKKNQLLLLHGKRDQVVPFKEGLTLFQAANEPKEMLVFADKHHGDLWHVPGFSEKIIQFVRHWCLQ